MRKAKDVLKTIVTALVEFPDQIQIEDKTDDMGVLLTLRVSKTDMGRVIGQKGGTAQALRVILRSIGMSENARICLKVEEPNE